MIGLGASSRYGVSNAYLFTPQRSESLAAHALSRLSPSRDTVTIPVTPVAKVRSVQPKKSEVIPDDPSTDTAFPLVREGTDPVEMAVRSRIEYLDPTQDRNAILADHSDPLTESLKSLQSAQSPQEVMEDGECQTCQNRNYQDGSDDPGVSFKTAAHIAPEQAAATVRGHEMEHVSHEQSKAAQEDRKVVSQTVTMHTAICPECGDVYVSGGQTRTTTKADTQPEGYQQPQQQAVPLFEAIA